MEDLEHAAKNECEKHEYTGTLNPEGTPKFQ